MNIKDYIPYYISCRCINSWFPEGHEMYDNNWVLNSIDITSQKPFRLDSGEDYTWTDSVKPLLRRLSDMTEQEGIPIFGNDMYWDVVCQEGDYKRFTVNQFSHLLKQGFDLFGLIDAGVAIDSNTIKEV